MESDTDVFQIQRVDDTVIVTPLVDLLEIHYERIAAGAGQVLQLLADTPARNVVLDLHKTDSLGSTALSFFTRLWNRARSSGGRMALCHVSPHELRVLSISKFDTIWPICATRDDALNAVHAEPDGAG